jgi:hypothetical protein
MDEILHNQAPAAPYDDPHYMEYVKLNHSRSNRWTKTGVLIDEVKAVIKDLIADQKWILITEPWCGDAAHSVPFIVKMAELSSHIKLEIQLRDNGSEIDSYLTNGGKSIPKLIIRNESNEDQAVWGPRPQACQALFEQLKEENKDFEEQKIALQNWYNQDKGVSIQQELAKLIYQANPPF